MAYEDLLMPWERGSEVMAFKRNQVIKPWSYPWVVEYWDGNFGITVTGSGVSSWVPVKGTHALTQGTDSARPQYATGVLSFDGSAQYLTSGAFTLSQPVEFFAVLKPKRYNHGSFQNMVNGPGADAGIGIVNGGTNIYIYAGSNVVQAAGPAINTACVFNWKFDAANSFWATNLNAATTGNPGNNSPGGVIVGTNNTVNSFSVMECSALGYTKTALTSAEREQMIRVMARRYRVGL